MSANNDRAVEISSHEFEETINSKEISVIDFYAEWCLAPKTKLLFNPCAKNIEKVKRGSRILSFDKNFEESFVEVKSIHKILSNKKIKITTERGREISCTPEHLILTNNGFCKAKDLTRENLVSTYLFSSYPFIGEDKRLFLTEEKIMEIAKRFKNKEKYINELKENGLLRIKYNDGKAYILASLVGLLLSDGSLSSTKNHERLTEFFVTEKDKIEVIKDLKSLGFNASSRGQEIKGKINNREFIQKITRVRVSKTSLFVLFSALGAIKGKKFIKGLKVPEWILKGPKEIQRAFLQGFLGGDGPKIEVRTLERKNKGFYNKPLINPIEFHFYSKAKNTSKKFAQELSSLLNTLNVEIKKIEISKEKRYERKDKKVSMLLKIQLKSNLESAYNYSSIGFKYCYSKKLASSLAREYLMERLTKIKDREKKKLFAIKLKGKLPINDIAKKLNLSYSVINNWFSGGKASPPRDAIRYNEWLKIHIKDNKIAYDKIKNIEKEDKKLYPFISLSLNNDTKMFVANEIIHHNCMPCLMIAPVLEDLAEKFKEIKFARVNVDENRELSSKFSISVLPCLVVFKKGREVDRIVGALPEEVLSEKISKHIE